MCSELPAANSLSTPSQTQPFSQSQLVPKCQRAIAVFLDCRYTQQPPLIPIPQNCFTSPLSLPATPSPLQTCTDSASERPSPSLPQSPIFFFSSHHTQFSPLRLARSPGAARRPLFLCAARPPQPQQPTREERMRESESERHRESVSFPFDLACKPPFLLAASSPLFAPAAPSNRGRRVWFPNFSSLAVLF